MKRGRELLITSIAFCTGLCAQTGRVRGLVFADDTEAPQAGATVVAIGQPADSSLGQPAIARAVTDTDGSYTFDELPGGVYRFCVHDAGERLDPCQWSQGVHATVGQAVSTLDIPLRRGVRLSVRIEDTAGFVMALKDGSPALGAVPGALVNVTLVDSAGRRMLLPLTDASDRLYEYSALVPPDTDFTLVVASQAFSLANASGDAVEGEAVSIPLRLSVPPVRDPRVRLPFMSTAPPAHVVGLTITGLAQVIP